MLNLYHAFNNVGHLHFNFYEMRDDFDSTNSKFPIFFHVGLQDVVFQLAHYSQYRKLCKSGLPLSGKLLTQRYKKNIFCK